MKQLKISHETDKSDALRALKNAIIQGATWRYEQLVAMAVKVGVTDSEIDDVAHQALAALLEGAEQPLTVRELSSSWYTTQFRH